MSYSIIGKRVIFQNNNFVFKLISKNGKEVFMRINETPYNNENRYVVFVYIYDFYKYYSEGVNCKFDGYIPIEDTYFKQKYDNATSRFTAGLKNPVPLSDVSARFTEKLEIQFTDGKTRTQWLLNNNFSVYPVKTEFNSAQLLQKHFGLRNGNFYSVKELMENGQYNFGEA